MSKLSSKLSKVLRQALNDLSVLRRDSRYRVSMKYWHAPDNTGCKICLAGACMARSLKTSPVQPICPSSFDEADRNRLVALDCIRRGNIHDAVITIDKDPSDYKLPSNYRIGAYSKKHYKNWRRRLLNVASMLEKNGL